MRCIFVPGCRSVCDKAIQNCNYCSIYSCIHELIYYINDIRCAIQNVSCGRTITMNLKSSRFHLQPILVRTFLGSIWNSGPSFNNQHHMRTFDKCAPDKCIRILVDYQVHFFYLFHTMIMLKIFFWNHVIFLSHSHSQSNFTIHQNRNFIRNSIFHLKSHTNPIQIPTKCPIQVEIKTFNFMPFSASLWI